MWDSPNKITKEIFNEIVGCLGKPTAMEVKYNLEKRNEHDDFIMKRAFGRKIQLGEGPRHEFENVRTLIAPKNERLSIDKRTLVSVYGRTVGSPGGGWNGLIIGEDGLYDFELSQKRVQEEHEIEEDRLAYMFIEKIGWDLDFVEYWMDHTSMHVKQRNSNITALETTFNLVEILGKNQIAYQITSSDFNNRSDFSFPGKLKLKI